MAVEDFTVEDLTAIRRAIAKGERSVQFADRSVTYRSMDELLVAEQRIAGALAAVQGTRRSKHFYITADKGLGAEAEQE